ncbi:MAG: RNA methyltransferase [Hyphomicrobiales bacterium]|nr:RNA methyltransferase [Hyphomicrobiales bacterium]
MVLHPVIILVRPQLGWNIGAAARAMANFGLNELRLVTPRGRHPSASALKMASGAESIVERAQVFDNLESAVADLSVLLATSARRREMMKEEITPKDAAMRLRATASSDSRAGILFGPERAGLENDELVLAEALIKVPTDPGFSSLNLGQCVLLLAYEYFLTGEPLDGAADDDEPPATREDLLGFFEQLEGGLEGSKFFHPEEMRAATVRKIRNFFSNARPNARQLRMLRGIVSALRGKGVDRGE